MCNPQRRCSPAFTLTEVRVVVVMIAILVAIFPSVVSQAKEKSVDDICMSNLSKFGVAFMMYAGDYDGWLPGHMAGEGACGAWMYKLASYVKFDHDVYRCPSDKNPGKAWYDGTNTFGLNRKGAVPEQAVRGSYGVNRKIIPYRDTPRFFQLAGFIWPSEACLMTDTKSGLSLSSPKDFSYYHFGRTGEGEDWRKICVPRHNNGYNLLYVDGHVEWFAEEFPNTDKFWLGK